MAWTDLSPYTVGRFTAAMAELLRGNFKAIGDPWTDYGTPSTLWATSGTQPTIGNGVLAGRYWAAGKKFEFSISLVIGSTTNVGTGTWSFLLPVSMQNFRCLWGKADCFNGSIVPRQISGVNATSFTVHSEAGTRLSGTVPFTWSSTHRLDIVGGGEVA